MKSTCLLAIIIFFFSFFSSGSRCDNLDCLTDNYSVSLRIVDKVDEKDLVFGSSAIYDSSEIKFYTTNGSDTTVFKHSFEKYPGTGFDSIMTVAFFPQTDRPIYMKLNDQDTDTLSVAYNTFESKCCGIITEIKNIQVNTNINFPGGTAPQSIRK